MVSSSERSERGGVPARCAKGSGPPGISGATVTVDAAGAEQYRIFHDYEPFVK
jgi:hypothetical protein